MRKPALYGHLCDTGPVEVTASAGHEKHGGILTGKVELRVEVWTAAPFGKGQERGHCMEVFMAPPVTDGVYEDAYKRILGTYEGYWKDEGATVDPSWKEKLARACGKAMGAFMRGEIGREWDLKRGVVSADG